MEKQYSLEEIKKFLELHVDLRTQVMTSREPYITLNNYRDDFAEHISKLSWSTLLDWHRQLLAIEIPKDDFIEYSTSLWFAITYRLRYYYLVGYKAKIYWSESSKKINELGAKEIPLNPDTDWSQYLPQADITFDKLSQFLDFLVTIREDNSCTPTWHINPEYKLLPLLGFEKVMRWTSFLTNVDCSIDFTYKLSHIMYTVFEKIYTNAGNGAARPLMVHAALLDFQDLSPH